MIANFAAYGSELVLVLGLMQIKNLALTYAFNGDLV